MQEFSDFLHPIPKSINWVGVLKTEKKNSVPSMGVLREKPNLGSIGSC